MVTIGTTTPEPTPLPGYHVTYPKKGYGSICAFLDPKHLKTIIHEHHKVPVLKETKHRLPGSKVFLKLDAYNNLWSVHLDHKLSLLTAFNTPLGWYCLLSMPF